MPTKRGSGRRKIHVDLPTQLHQKLRIKAALDGVSMQALVTRLVDAAVVDIRLASNRRKRPKER